MLDSVFIDVAIGVALVFFLVASIVAALNEWVTRMLDVRAKVLWKALANALDKGAGEPFEIGFPDSLKWFSGDLDTRPKVTDGAVGVGTTTERLANTALVKTLGGTTGNRLTKSTLVKGLGGPTRTSLTKVDAIGSETFAAALVQVASRAGHTEVVEILQQARSAHALAVEAAPVPTSIVAGWGAVQDLDVVDQRLADAGIEPALGAGIKDSAAAWAKAAAATGDAADLAAAVALNPQLASSIESVSDALSDVLERLRSLVAGSPIEEVIDSTLTQTAAGIDEVTMAISDWFDDTMKRLSDLYRISARKILFVAGFVIAVVLNVSAIDLVDDLEMNADARTALVTAASGACGEGATQDACEAAFTSETGKVTLPLVGEHVWPWDALGLFSDIDPDDETSDVDAWFEVIAGWLITGFAVSFGAPFWFDVVQRVGAFRGRVTAA